MCFVPFPFFSNRLDLNIILRSDIFDFLFSWQRFDRHPWYYHRTVAAVLFATDHHSSAPDSRRGGSRTRNNPSNSNSLHCDGTLTVVVFYG